MLEKLKEAVYQGNMALKAHGLVLFTWGNVSAIDRESGYVVIKPSGVAYERMSPEDMVVVDLDGNVVEGHYKPSSDTPTHLVLYKAFESLGSVVHTHSKWACIWAQSGKAIPDLGTTHSDHFYGEVPITRDMTPAEIKDAYEAHTGDVIVESFMKRAINVDQCGAVLVMNHGPFTFAKSIDKAVENAAVLEYVAEMAYYSLSLNDKAQISHALEAKHFFRKHGKNAYYGQGTIEE